MCLVVDPCVGKLHWDEVSSVTMSDALIVLTSLSK